MRWQELFEGARLRAERSLGRPVTHAVVAVAAPPDRDFAALLAAASEKAGLALLRVIAAGERGDEPAALTAAILAEDLAPRPAAP